MYTSLDEHPGIFKEGAETPTAPSGRGQREPRLLTPFYDVQSYAYGWSLNAGWLSVKLRRVHANTQGPLRRSSGPHPLRRVVDIVSRPRHWHRGARCDRFAWPADNLPGCRGLEGLRPHLLLPNRVLVWPQRLLCVHRVEGAQVLRSIYEEDVYIPRLTVAKSMTNVTRDPHPVENSSVRLCITVFVVSDVSATTCSMISPRTLKC